MPTVDSGEKLYAFDLDSSWVEVEGVITKGEYHGERPVIEVNCIKETSVPNDEFVYPPDDGFVSSET